MCTFINFVCTVFNDNKHACSRSKIQCNVTLRYVMLCYVLNLSAQIKEPSSVKKGLDASEKKYRRRSACAVCAG